MLAHSKNKESMSLPRKCVLFKAGMKLGEGGGRGRGREEGGEGAEGGDGARVCGSL